MKRTAMLRRSGFRRPELPPRQRPVPVPRSEPARVRIWRADDAPIVTIPKDNPVRDEDYRRLVASFPCAICGVIGYSQCAHANSVALGKGKGIKASDDLTFPLCACRPLQPGCHRMYDAGALVRKEDRMEWEARAVARTQEMARAAGWKFKEAA